jgi:hypothetical protein
MQLYDSKDTPAVMLLIDGPRLLEAFSVGEFFSRFQRLCDDNETENTITVRVQVAANESSLGGVVVIPRTDIPLIIQVEAISELDREILRKLVAVDF